MALFCRYHPAMSGSWRVSDKGGQVTGAEAVNLFRVRAMSGPGDTWFECSDGRQLGVTTNGERAMVMLLREVDDPGEHAVDPTTASDEHGGYVLSNGQQDVFPDRDTIPLDQALGVVARVIERGEPRAEVEWQVDRGPE